MSEPQVDRRIAMRYPVTAETTCPFVLPVKDDYGPARIRDVSTDGIGLLTNRPLEEGTLIVIALKNTTHNFFRTQVVQVAHCTPQLGGSYVVGGTFLTPLSYEELRTLLM